MWRLLLFVVETLLLLLMVLPSRAKFSRKTKEQVIPVKAEKIFLPTPMLMIVAASLRRKQNWKHSVATETRASSSDWRLEETAGKFFLQRSSNRSRLWTWAGYEHALTILIKLN